MLPGVDFCRFSLELSRAGRVPEGDHLSSCPICLRRWRITEAGLQGWSPMEHAEAMPIVVEMATSFQSRERNDSYRRFYAHLALCQQCERGLAELTFDLPPSRD